MICKLMYASRMIPSDIITQILYRLPSKSIGRFRSVSKEWLSLLTQPKFVETQRKTLNRNHHIFTDEEYVLYSHPFDHDESYIKPTTKLLPIDLTTAASSIRIRGSCDGLLLVSLGNNDMGDFVELDSEELDPADFEILVLLNPTTREFMQLPKSVRDDPHKRKKQEESVQIGNAHWFGYDSVTDDYKVVIFTYFVYYIGELDESGPELVTRITLRVSIYSLKSNTWRKLIVDDSPYYDYRRSSPAVYVNGFLHWIVKKNHIDRSNIIVAFSLVDECFSEVPPPSFCNHTDIMCSDYCGLVVLGGKLAIYESPQCKRREQCFDLWLMNEYGVKDSWTKIPLDMFGNRELCMRKSMIFYDNGKIRVASKKKKQMLIYDFVKGEFSKDAYFWSRKFRLFSSYAESLVSPTRRFY